MGYKTTTLSHALRNGVDITRTAQAAVSKAGYDVLPYVPMQAVIQATMVSSSVQQGLP